MKSREKLIQELKEYRELIKKENSKGKQKVYTKNDKGYMDAIVLALLTGLAGGIMIGISLMISNIFV